ncbi:uncharacterized protein AC631_00515 [Debaryomyces fabryi]|uniref:Phosphotransferase n=1 Tax=Debaryomyces fabryi TaxID=58627 RepID=A0A0V1Q5E9_9ASCO|nr:uncharacterized protein AC631_00515 [Debaryomyces fabryi]KSA03703.1 hypothetical protein AC631_00515 [Debaryomyces fabryi]
MIHTITTPGFSTLSGTGTSSPLKDQLLHPVIEETASIDSDVGTLSSSPSSLSSNLSIVPKTRLEKAVQEFTQNVDPCSLKYHSDSLLDDFNESLSENSKLTMLPNYNISPTGMEEGNFLIIDVGGSTLRVAVIRIDPFVAESEDRSKRVHIIIEKKWHINDSSKTIDSEFFKWLSSKVYETLQEQNLIKVDDLVINTGISWSFPLEQVSHNSGKIVYVGKGYTIASDIYNQDLKSILEKSLSNNFNINIDIKTIINDSLAVYSAGSFLDKHMKLALVLGTGFNMCCSLNTSKLHEGKKLHQDAILLNTELSLFGHTLISDLASKYDSKIDKRFDLKEATLNFKPHMTVDPLTNDIFQPSELMTSGRYLCELTRLILIDLIEAKEIFTQLHDKELSPIFRNYEGITGQLVCFISEVDDETLIIDKLCDEFGWNKSSITLSDISKLKIIVNSVIQRAAFIVAIAMVSFIKLLNHHNGCYGQDLLTIGYVGSVLLHFKNYRKLILKYVNDNEDIKRLNIRIDFKSIDNSSIVGAAIGAAYYK